MNTSSYDDRIQLLEEKKKDLLTQLETQAQTFIRERAEPSAQRISKEQVR